MTGLLRCPSHTHSGTARCKERVPPKTVPQDQAGTHWRADSHHDEWPAVCPVQTLRPPPRGTPAQAMKRERFGGLFGCSNTRVYKIHVRQKLCLVTEFIFMPLIWISGVVDAIRKPCTVSRKAYSYVNVASIISPDPASHTPM